MPKTSSPPRYGDQRPRVTPPHVGLADLRAAVGLTLDEVCERVAEHRVRLTRGGLSAIENGHRGASASVLRALAMAYGLREDALTTTYVPRTREVRERAVA